MMRVAVTSAAFSPDAEVAQFVRGSSGDAGALATFVGYCRAKAHDGEVEQLELDHYPGLTEAELHRMAESAMLRHALLDVLVIHRVGAIRAGEPIVLVAALSAHRAAAFQAVEELMDRLKTDAPFWKREIGRDGARWIEPTDVDRARRAAHGETS